MKIIRKARYARLMAGAAVGALTLGASAAWAQEKPITIPAQTLASALHDFGSQTGRPIMFSPSATASKQTQGVSGVTDEQVALTQLLQGTGLTFRREANAFVIVQQGEGGSPQSGSAAGGGATVEALIVTAQKREEDIQDVPIAISAFSQEDLTRSQIAGGPDLITQVPNMTFTKTNFSSFSVQIRGIGTQAISATTDPAVAIAFNNTPFIRNRFFEQEFYDLQRVEVLRGPQGTLYGRNATAGVVNIISAKPKFFHEAKASADIANYNSSRIEGMVNIPLVEDAVALRLAGAWTKRDGYAFNELTGGPIDGRDLWSTRLSLRIAPLGSRFDVNLIWEHFEEDDDRLRSGKQLCKKHTPTHVGDILLPTTGDNIAGPQPTHSTGCERGSLYSPEAFQTVNGLSVPYFRPLANIGVPVNTLLGDPYSSTIQSRDLRVIESTLDPIYRANADLGELQIQFDLTDELTLQSETAYSTDFVYSLQDFNRFNTQPGAWKQPSEPGVREGVLQEGPVGGIFCDPQIGCSDRLVAVDLSTAESVQFSQEFRLSSQFSGSFNFNLGANYLRYDTEDKYYVFINTLSLGAANRIVGGMTDPYVSGVTDHRECLPEGYWADASDPLNPGTYTCIYIDPNPIESLNDQGHNYFLSRNPFKLISYAVFGEAYWNLTEALKLTAGLRYSVDNKEAPRIPSWTFVGTSFGYPVTTVVEQEWREPTGRLVLDWKPDLTFTDETLVYASYAHGYKAGGSNPPPYIRTSFDASLNDPDSELRPKTFDAEYVDAFELGSKNTFLDGNVTLNVAAFYYDYKGYQVSEIVDRQAFNRNFDVEVWGGEIEADWRPLENLRLAFKGGLSEDPHRRRRGGDRPGRSNRRERRLDRRPAVPDTRVKLYCAGVYLRQ